MFCENCGLQFLPVQSVCTRCGATSTRHWFQLMSLVTLVVAAGCNALVACFLLPRLIAHADRLAAMHAGLVVRAWLWTDLKASAYGWIPLGLGLLAWDYFLRQESQTVISEKIKDWVVRGLLVVGFVMGVVPLVPRWLRPPAALLASHAKLPHLPLVGAFPELAWLLPWGLVGLAAALLCLNAETRDALLGHGRILSAASVAVLVLVLMMTLIVFPA